MWILTDSNDTAFRSRITIYGLFQGHVGRSFREWMVWTAHGLISVHKLHMNERTFRTKRSDIFKVNGKPPFIVASVHSEKIRNNRRCRSKVKGPVTALVNCRSSITIVMYSFQKAKSLELQSDSSLKVLKMTNNTFISQFKSSTLSETPFLFSNVRLQASRFWATLSLSIYLLYPFIQLRNNCHLK